MKNILLFLALITLSANVSGQSRKEKKWRAAIATIEKADFFPAYIGKKDTIEENVQLFLRAAADYLPGDIEEVRIEYERTVRTFDQILDDIKSDFTDKGTRKLMVGNPDKYTNLYERELRLAFVEYKNGCLHKIMRIGAANNSNLATIGIMEIPLLVSLFKELFDMVKDINRNMAEMSADYFEKNLLEKYRLKRWEHYSLK